MSEVEQERAAKDFSGVKKICKLSNCEVILNATHDILARQQIRVSYILFRVPAPSKNKHFFKRAPPAQILLCLAYVTSRGVRAVPWRQSNLRAGGRLFIESDTKSELNSTRPLTEVKSKSPGGFSLGSTPLTFSSSASVDDTSSSLLVHTVWMRKCPEMEVKEFVLKAKQKFRQLKRYVGQIGSRIVPDPFFILRCVFRWCQ